MIQVKQNIIKISAAFVAILSENQHTNG